MKILLVEDDQNLAHMLQELLKSQHYLVEVAFDGETGLELAIAFEYDLILLDVMLPKQSGIYVCQQLRAQKNPVPILLLTAQGASEYRVAGLDAGADDYLTKPIDVPELLARIRALLRRGQDAISPMLEWQGLRLDPATGQVTGQHQPLTLTAKEYALVELFLRNPQRIFSSSALIDRLWDAENLPMENAVRAHIKSLRRKLKEVGLAEILETVIGLGYRLRAEPSAVQEKISEGSGAESSASQFVTLWQQYRPQYLERAEHLNQAIAALASPSNGPSNDHMLQQAQQQAHTLAGSLGSFGLEWAAQLAAEINQRLLLDEQLKPSDLQRLQKLGQTLQQVIQETTEDFSIELMPLSEPSHSIRLLIIDDDPALANQLASLASPYGIQTQIESNPERVLSHLTQWHPDVVLLDLNFPEAPEAGFDLLREFSTQALRPPVIVFTARDRYADRVKASHLGSSIFLHKPVSPSVVISTVLQVYTQSNPTNINLMLVAADSEQTKTIESLIASWGFNCTSVRTAQQCWKKLPEAQPDLLLVDANLSKGSSFDLCQVVRNEPSWSNLPIVFMVVSMEPEIIQQICAAGGSACIVKPVAEAELISRILYCVKVKRRDQTREVVG
jgi:DNA-binding response OmpR family regulator/HPt (histidine-containing phosphotransfer) domain-containing protein